MFAFFVLTSLAALGVVIFAHLRAFGMTTGGIARLVWRALCWVSFVLFCWHLVRFIGRPLHLKGTFVFMVFGTLAWNYFRNGVRATPDQRP
jgi:hypothetical protein